MCQLYLWFDYVKNNSLIFRFEKRKKKVDDFKSYFEKKKVWFKNSFCPIVINPIHVRKKKK